MADLSATRKLRPDHGGRTRVERDHIFHKPQTTIPLKREDGLRMELHGLNGEMAMADAHDDAVFRFSGDFETCRKRRAIGVEGMIPADSKWRRQVAQHALSMMMNK